jgi:hypothetical protein
MLTTISSLWSGTAVRLHGMVSAQADLRRRGFDRLEQLDDKVLDPSSGGGGSTQMGDGSFGTGVGRRLGTA